MDFLYPKMLLLYFNQKVFVEKDSLFFTRILSSYLDGYLIKQEKQRFSCKQQD